MVNYYKNIDSAVINLVLKHHTEIITIDCVKTSIRRNSLVAANDIIISANIRG